MRRRLLSWLIFSLLLMGSDTLCAGPNLAMLNFFTNENIFSSSLYGGRTTLGFGSEEFSGHTSFRLHPPNTNMTFHFTRRVHGSDSLLKGFLLGNLSYTCYGEANATTSLIAAYALKISTPSKNFPLILRSDLGLQGTLSSSNSFEHKILDLDIYLSGSVTQGFFDRFYGNLFIATDTLCMREGNLSFWYGSSLALALSEHLVLSFRALVRFSDYLYESRFITERELSCSLFWTTTPNRKLRMEEMGVWL